MARARDAVDPCWASDEWVSDECGLDMKKLERLERSIIHGTHPYNARNRLKSFLRCDDKEEYERWRMQRHSLCCSFRPVVRWGRSALEKNMDYSGANHRAMCNDVVRVQAYAEAIRHAACGKRVLDVGTGPFMLLGRLAHNAGAALVACVEHSAASVQTASELLELEYQLGDWRRPSTRQMHAGAAPSTRQMHADFLHQQDQRDNLALLDRLRARVRPAHLTLCRPPASDAFTCKMERAGALDGFEHVRQKFHGCSPAVIGTTTTPPVAEPSTDSGPLPTIAAIVEPSSSSSSGRREVQLFQGLSSRVALPGAIDLIVHEILGHIASSEGVVLALRELLARPGLAAQGVRMLPCAAGTMIFPTAVLEPSLLERLLQYETTDNSHTRAQSMYYVRGFPRSKLLAQAQAMEWYDFNGELPLQQCNRLQFIADAPGWFDGVLLHLRVQLDEHTCIDSFASQTTWSCIYVRLLGTGHAIWLAGGSRIELHCRIDVGSHTPRYAISASIAQPGGELQHAASYSWCGDN